MSKPVRHFNPKGDFSTVEKSKVSENYNGAVGYAVQEVDGKLIHVLLQKDSTTRCFTTDINWISPVIGFDLKKYNIDCIDHTISRR